MRRIAVLPCLLASLGLAQEAPDLHGLEQQWNDLYAREDLSASQRLADQSEVVRAAGLLLGWRDAQVWDWTRQVLFGWEASADLETAYAAYLSLLDQIGESAGSSEAPLPDEGTLRDFYQRALSIARTPAEEGRLLFYLAESVLRSSPDTHETRRRAEAYLQQAALSLSDVPPMDAVQYRLAELYRGWDSVSEGAQEEGESYLSRVVFHYRYIQGMASAREPYLEASAAVLEELLSPGLDLQVANRFLPENDIRISINCRNLQQVTLEVYSLSWQMQEHPVLHSRMQQEWLAGEPPYESLVFSKTLPVTSRQRYDWEEHEFRLGENFASGWYWVRVTGGDLMDQDLMLVTPLELVVIPRRPDFVSAWVVDAESGHAVPHAAYQVLGVDGQLLTSGMCDANGLAQIEIQADGEWAEIHVTDGMSPALVRKQDLDNGPEPISPWIIPGSTEVEAGGILEWMVLATDNMPGTGVDSTLVRLPDGRRLAGSFSRIGPHALIGRAAIPQSAGGAGPVFLELPTGDQVMVSHLKTEERFPLIVDLSGERYEEGANLFLSSSPVAVRIFSNATTDAPVPDYLRVRVTAFDRKAFYQAGELPVHSEDNILMETIFKFGTAEGGNTHFDLPEIDANGELLTLRIEAFSLDSSDLIGQAHLALLPYRTLVSLKLSEQLVGQGDTVEVDIGLTKAGESSPRSFEGELIVFRETWESRYIHRKKGTLLSEADYLALPDRSLLGAAKTDYRLLEQGFVREEISRIPVNVDQLSSIPIKLDRAGYYHIEFEGREMETRANYPDGPLEVWVIPDSLDLRAFHSERPRLITEYGIDGTQQMLLLLDRKEISVLMDLERKDGSVTSQVLKPEATALYLEEDAGTAAPWSVCRAVVVGERRADILSRHIEQTVPPRWDLQADRSNGLNPGTEFQWILSRLEGDLDFDAAWIFYPDPTVSAIFRLIDAQKDEHLAKIHDADLGTISLNKWLPIYHPFAIASQTAQQAEPAKATDVRDPSILFALFPELMSEQKRAAAGATFHALEAVPPGEAIPVQGTLPGSAGRWAFTVFSLLDNTHLDWQSWPLSTELPIRTTLEGPAILRIGDRAWLSLALENTTRGQEQLEVNFEATGAIAMESVPSFSKSLERRQLEEIPVQVMAGASGVGRLSARASGRNSTSEASFELSVPADSTYPTLEAFAVQPGNASWNQVVSLQDWSQAQILVSAGLGSLLPELWSPMRRHVRADPLLAALGDWALERVRSHHGIQAAATTHARDQLVEQLQQYRSGGGWTWTPGHSADPWMTAMVLWSLETFSSLSEDGFDTIRAEAREFLESVLIEEGVAMDVRLFALHALASPAYNDPRVRPSRIQARTFLSLLHDRAQLSNAGFATLLQVARAYRFTEEVRLLSPELVERVRTRGIPVESGFWARSLIYMAFGEIRNAEATRGTILQAAIENLSNTGFRRNWLQFGGFLNLLATFLWEGDFNVEGRATLQIDGAEPSVLDLKPDGSQNGYLIADWPIETDGPREVSLRLDTSAARVPVIVAALGQRTRPPAFPPFPEQSEQLLREYVEETLLAGQRQEIQELQEESVLHPGDVLQVILSLYVEDPEAFGEFHFSVPAGASLSPDAIQHAFEPSSTEDLFTPPQLSHVEQADPFLQVVRMESLAPGRHEFILSYRVNWSGDFIFPSHQLYIPKTGQVYQIGKSWRLEVEPW